jgi:transposase-like protein
VTPSKGLPETINTTWEDATVQTCVTHLPRNTFKYAGRHDWDKITAGLRPVHQAATVTATEERFLEFSEVWGAKYPAIIKLWTSAWEEFIPFSDWDVKIRKTIRTTNTIESPNTRYRPAVRARGHFPNDTAALKRLHLVTRPLDPTDKGKTRSVMRWKPTLNAFAISFPSHMDPAEDN